MRVRKAVIPVAGLGTRFLPATKALPKEMLPVADKPVIQYIVEEAVASGIENVVFVTSRYKRAIEDHFDTHFELESRLAALGRREDVDIVRHPTELAQFTFVRQGEPRGNGHAVLSARAAIGDEPFAMLWGDDLVSGDVPCLHQMMEVYERHHGAVTAALRVPGADVSRYGMIDGEQIEDRVYRVNRIIEKPLQASPNLNLAAVHAWILPPRIFSLLERTPPGRGGEIWLVDAIEALLREEPVFAVEFEGRHYDVGDKLEFLQAQVEFSLSRPDLGPRFRTYLKGLTDGW